MQRMVYYDQLIKVHHFDIEQIGQQITSDLAAMKLFQLHLGVFGSHSCSDSSHHLLGRPFGYLVWLLWCVPLNATLEVLC